jgi:hypothetical protein
VRRIAWLLAAGLAVLALFLIGEVVGIMHRHGATPPANDGPPGANGAVAAGRRPTGPGSAAGPNLSGAGRRSHESTGPFRLVIHTLADTIDVGVAPFSVGSYQLVDPPHSTAREWNTAAWIVQSTYPTQPSRGTSYIYGHACQYIVCSFNNLKNAQVGDKAQITTHGVRLNYQVDRIGLSPKTASSLPEWASDSTVPDRIVLVTCSYERDGASPDNLVVIAHLLNKPGQHAQQGAPSPAA